MEEARRLILGLYLPGIVQTIIRYGRLNGNDVDLLVVLNDNSRYNNFQIGIFDINTIGNDWLPMMCKYLDPIVVDPILKGNIIYGTSLQYYKKVILEQRVDDDTISYLLECADIFLNFASEHLAQNSKYDSIVAIYFAVSYIYYSLYYKNNQMVATFTKVVSEFRSVFLSQIRDIVKTKGYNLDTLEIEHILYMAKELLAKKQ